MDVIDDGPITFSNVKYQYLAVCCGKFSHFAPFVFDFKNNLIARVCIYKEVILQINSSVTMRRASIEDAHNDFDL